MDSRFNRVAGDLRTYVDDVRAIGITKDHAWRIARWIATRIQFLGSQDSSRKRRIDQGPCAGTVVVTTEEAVYKTVVQASKWQKAKQYIEELKSILN